MLFICLLIRILVVEGSFGGEHEVKEGSPIALCISVSRWGGVHPFRYGQPSFLCSQNDFSPVAPSASPRGEGGAAQKDTHGARLPPIARLRSLEAVRSAPLAAFLLLTCPNTPVWVFQRWEGKVGCLCGFTSGKVCPQADIRLLNASGCSI